MPHDQDHPEKNAGRPEHEPWQHATGPKSLEGKSISSQNARTHGCTSTQLLLPHEDAAEWEALKTSWLRDYSPDCATFRELVLAAATAQWFVRRNDKRLNEAEQFLHTEGGPSPIFWLEPQHRLYERILRYRTAAERSFLRARAAVEQYRRSRFIESKELARLAEKEQQFAASQNESNDEPGNTSSSFQPPPPPTVRTFLQHFRITASDGVTLTRGYPPNAEVIRNAARFDPPIQIRRTFHFEDGVPPEYGWIQQTPENRGRKDQGYFLEFSPAEFLALSALEEAADTPHLPDSSAITTARNGRELLDTLMDPQAT